MIRSKLTNILFYSCILIVMSCYNGRSNKKLNANSPVQVSRILSDQHWTEDLEQLYTLLKTTHRDLYHKSTPAQFEALFQEIKRAIPKLTDDEVIVQFTRLAALAHDGHTRLSLPLPEGFGLGQGHTKTPDPSHQRLIFRALPVAFFGFDDGVYITKATQRYAHYIGKKVTAINGVSMEDALTRAKAISHFDNASGYRLVAPSMLSILEILQGLDIVNLDTSNVQLTLENGTITEQLEIQALARTTSERLQDVWGVTTVEKPYYSYEYLVNQKALYVQINRMNDAPTGPSLVEFIGTLDDLIQKKEVTRLVLDLRNNFGGNNANTVPIVHLITKHTSINTIGHLYTLIGRKTFSAAQNLVNDLSTWTNVIFVGEPTGAAPSHYGDAKKTQLTHSNLTVRISSVYWRDSSVDEQKPWTQPDIPVANTAADYFQQHDTGLATCLEFTPSTNWLDTYYRLCVYGGMDTAKRLYTRFPLDWKHTQADFKALENMLVQRILNKDSQ